MAKTVGVILSGCGYLDGSEITESVLSLLALARSGFKTVILAPNMMQYHVINHLTAKPAEGERRNVLVEAARIARGHMRDVAHAAPEEFDALFLPGGYGAAKNLSTFAFDGPNAKVNEDVARLIKGMHTAKKPMGFVCIAPAIVAKVLGSGVRVTIGNDPATASALEGMGAKHVPHAVQGAEIDRTHRIVTAPAYMYDATILEVEASINAAVSGLVELLG